MRNASRAICALAVLAASNPVHAEVPQSICVQGYLEDLGGQEVDAQVTFGVCIYDALTGGNQVWPTLPAPCASIMTLVSDGLFTICPGAPSDEAIAPEVFGAIGAGPQPRWIEISTGGQPMQPRIELHTAPYASRVGLVDNPELTDDVELGSSTPGNPGSLTAFDSAGSPTIALHGASGDAHFAGNVGIGTQSPTASLDVNGAARTTTLEITGGDRLAQPIAVWGFIPWWLPFPSTLLNVPSGTLTAISMTNAYAIGIRDDGTLVGWGNSNYVPTGTFTAVSAGPNHALAIRSDGNLVGWGDNYCGATNVPQGTFTAIAVGDFHSVAIRDDGTLAVWGCNMNNPDGSLGGLTPAPEGTFTAVAASASYGLGIRQDGTIVGWGGVRDFPYMESVVNNVPPGTFVGVAATHGSAVGIRTDGTLVAWGDGVPPILSVPAGTFIAVAVGLSHGLGIRGDGRLVGWGDNAYGQNDVPTGTFGAVATTGGTDVAIHTGPSGTFGLLLATDSATKPGSNTWTIYSDRRLKKDIAPLSGALDRLLQLRGVTFNWIDPAYQGGRAGTQMGLIADEVARVFPQWVGRDPKGYQTLTVGGFEALTTEALRELRNEKDAAIQKLEQENAELRETVQQLSDRLDALAGKR